MTDFDLDTVKMLMGIFVSVIFDFILALSVDKWNMKDSDRSGTINFTGTLYPGICSGT